MADALCPYRMYGMESLLSGEEAQIFIHRQGTVQEIKKENAPS